MPVAGHAQSVKLEAAYVVLGPQGAVARAVIADATRCPAIVIDGSEQAMNVRALPDAAFPVLEHVPPQLNQGDSRGAEDGRGYRH